MRGLVKISMEMLYGWQARSDLSMPHAVRMKVGKAPTTHAQAEVVCHSTKNQEMVNHSQLTVNLHIMFKTP